jgi:Protein of unknown function (DUF3455)
MKNGHAPMGQTTCRVLRIVCAAAIAAACMVSLPSLVYAAGGLVPPPVPANLEVPAGNKVFLEGHAIGTQNYICLCSAADCAWTFFGPQATLFNDYKTQILTHFLSPNPDPMDPMEEGTPRPTWQHSQDTSTVWARAISSSAPNFVDADAIPWLLLQVVGVQRGPIGGHRLTRTTFIQRLNTSGGVAPSTGCDEFTDVNKRAFVPYTADYFFYKAAERE